MINDVLDIRLAVQRVPFLLTRLSASSRGWAKYTSPYQSKRWTQARTSPLPEQATAAGDHSEGCEGYGRQEGRERGARQQRDPGSTLRIQTWRNRSVQERSDLGLRSVDPARRRDVEPNQPRITAQPGFLMANVAVRI